MSVRAYKIKKIETEQSPTFNLWHMPQEIWNLLSISEQLNDSGSGHICIGKSEVTEALERTKNPDSITTLKEILSDFNDKADYVEYACY